MIGGERRGEGRRRKEKAVNRPLKDLDFKVGWGGTTKEEKSRKKKERN